MRFDFAFFTEQGKVLLGLLPAAAHPQQQIGQRGICGGIALRGMEPINDIWFSCRGADDDLGRHKVAVADLVIFWDPLQPGIKIIPVGGGELRAVDIALKLILELFEHGAGLLVDVAVQRGEKFHILPRLFGIALHQLFQIFTLDVLRNNGPLAIYLGHLQNFGDSDGRFLHSGLVQRLIDDIRLGAVLIKNL